MSLLDAFKGANGSKSVAAKQEQPPGVLSNSGNGTFYRCKLHFRGEVNTNQANTTAGQSSQRVGSQQQSALLDLFKKPPSSQPSPQPTQAVEDPPPTISSPALSDATVTGRRSTANEITRTLPAKAKAKSPLPKPTHPTNNEPRGRNTGHSVASERGSPVLNPRNQRASSKAKRPEQQTPQFSILQRPGSSAGKSSVTPQSPLRYESSNPGQSSFHPQVLKRPTSTEVSEAEKSDVPIPEVRHQAHTPQNNPLLDLLNGRNTAPVVKTPEPPPAPQLLPERKVSQHGALPVGSHPRQQQNLLNLFIKSDSNGKHGGSPGTPISPFSLGTPAASKQREASFSEHAGEASRSRFGSIASVRSGVSSGQQTPTEVKGAMLDYLNGVVQKEGNRGAKKP